MKTPIEDGVLERTISKDRERLYRAWQKAFQRSEDDPDGAVTAARSFLESTCKHILDVLEISYGKSLDLSQQFRLVANGLKLTEMAETGQIEKQFLSGASQIVQSLGELRNRAGDAHGKGNLSARASIAHAELSVNIAGSLSIFLLRKIDSHLAATRRLNSVGNAVLRFDKSTAWRLVDHAQHSPDHQKALGQRKSRPGVWLVADAGIYLMSNGLPGLLQDGRLAKDGSDDGKLRLVAHADGCGPMDSIDDWTPLQIAMSGGDDFCEVLRIRDVKEALETCDRQIVIVSNNSFYRVFSDTEFDESAQEAHLD